MLWFKKQGGEKPHPYEAVRLRVRRFWEPTLAERRVAGLSTGLYPFNGAWPTEADIRAKRQNLARTDRALLADLVLVAGVALAVSAVFILLVEFVI